jgi:hypothetical protein
MAARTVAFVVSGIAVGILPFVIASGLGVKTSAGSGDSWALFLFPAGIPLQVLWFQLLDRLTLIRSDGRPAWFGDDATFRKLGRNVTIAYTFFAGFIVPALIAYTFAEPLFPRGLFSISVAASLLVAGICFWALLVIMERMDWIDGPVPGVDWIEYHDVGSSCWSAASSIVTGSIGTLIVAIVIVAPELLALAAGSIEPSYLLGYATGKVLVAFVVAGLVNVIVSIRTQFKHWRFNAAFLAIGVLVLLAQLKAKGVW